MPPKSPNDRPWRERIAQVWDVIARAFEEFLLLPTLLIIAFLLLAALTDWMDRVAPDGLAAVRQFLQHHFFAGARSTSNFLGYIAGGLVTVTSITASVLLVAVQQSASTMTARVFDQFLRRRLNQIYFGFFIGLALYALVILTTVSPDFNPVLGGAVAILLTVVALYLLIVLIYSTIDQMRPDVIVAAIHDHILGARKRELRIVQRTRRQSGYDGPCRETARTAWHGYVTRIDIPRIEAALKQCRGPAEIRLLVVIGSFVGYYDPVAQIHAQFEDDGKRLVHAVPRALRLERERDIQFDPSFGIEELEMVAWTSISSSKSNPEPGLLTIRALRDILARWVAPDREAEPSPDQLPLVYLDATMERLLGTLMSLGIAASESMQHQSLAEVLTVFTVMFGRLSPPEQDRAEDLICRLMTSVGDHVLSRTLEVAMRELAGVLEENGREGAAGTVRHVVNELGSISGRLASRSDRAALARGDRA